MPLGVWETLSWIIQGEPGVATQPGLLMPPIHQGFITQLVVKNGCVCYFVVYGYAISQNTQTVCEELQWIYKVLQPEVNNLWDALIFILL